MLLGNPGSLPTDVTPDQVRRSQGRGSKASFPQRPAMPMLSLACSSLAYPASPPQFIIVGSVAVAFRAALLVSAALCVRDFGSGLQQLFRRGDEERGGRLGVTLSAPLLPRTAAAVAAVTLGRPDEPFRPRAPSPGRGRGVDTDQPNPGSRGGYDDGGGGDGYGWGFVPQPQEQRDDADGDGFGFAPKPAQSEF